MPDTTHQRITWKTELEPFATLWADIVHRVESLPLDKLKKLLSATENPSGSNCWWATAEIAHLIRPKIKAEIQRKQSAIRPNEV